MKLLGIILILLSSNLFALEHIRVVWHENPSTEAFVAWTTDKFSPKKKNIVYYDTKPHNGRLSEYKHVLKTKHNKIYPYSFFDFMHAAKLTGLKPSTRYYFVVKSEDKVSNEKYFITAPAAGTNKTFKLLFGGDSRSDRAKRREINKKLSDKLEKDPSILALVHGGDYIQNGFAWDQWAKWLQDHQLTSTSDGRVLPIIPTKGNHEMSTRLYKRVFVFPGGRFKRNYFTSHLGDLAVVTLDSNVVVGGFQKHWLKKTLKKESQRKKWIVANYHRPIYPAVKKPSRAKKHWVPLFEKYQIDLAFESDGHTLKKTVPIYQDKMDLERGITYVGEGGLGVKLRSPKKRDAWYLQSPGFSAKKYHVMELVIAPEKMTLNIDLLDGTYFHSFDKKLKKRLP